MGSICVMGGGPAGSIFAIRMVQLGHEVDLIESTRFPRPHLGESLSPGVSALLRSLGAEGALDHSRRAREVEVVWDGDPLIRRDSQAEGRLVDRGVFDRWLIDHAQRVGVRIHQPARIVERRHEERGWYLAIDTEAGEKELTTDFLADGRGREGAGSWHRETTGPATLALHAYWEGAALPTHPVIKAGDDAWYWAVPLPDGICNMQAFVDARQFGALSKDTLAARYFDRLDRAGFRRGGLMSDVMARDATPFVACSPAAHSRIAIGEAALALDPLSSSGVQKAIQTSLSGAIVANTLIKRRASAGTAMAFYQTSLEEASMRHRKWAASYYAKVARSRPAAFWQARAGGEPEDALHRAVASADPHSLSSQPVQLSRDLVIADVPCIEGEFVTLKPALRHPGLAGPVAFLGDQALAPLVSGLRSGATLVEIAQTWSERLPFKSALSIAIWLRNNGILVDSAGARQ